MGEDTVSDLDKNTNPFILIDSTLREGEQFINSNFSTEDKVMLARALSDFGVEYIEMTNPASSERSFFDCQAVVAANVKAKILTHIRCTLEDAKLAVQTGVAGVDILFGTSSLLREFSHGKDISFVIEKAVEVVQFLKKYNVEIRFSSEDSFRSRLVDLLKVYQEVSRHGVDRVGIADTVGCATPTQVEYVVKAVQKVLPAGCGIEFHGHNDTACAVANSYSAVKAGALFVDTSILGIGERNGITSLGAFLARMYVDNPSYVENKYKLPKLKQLEDAVADMARINIPFNNCVTGFCAFTHKAGIHLNAVLNNPRTYEILPPEVFGMTRYLEIASRLTGWNAIKHRAAQLGLEVSEEDLKRLTLQIKKVASVKHDFSLSDVDVLLREHQKTS